MATNVRPGAVIFTRDKDRLTKFYKAMTELPERFADDQVTVLASDSFELVIHSISKGPAAGKPPIDREDTYVKPFFPVPSLSEARDKAVALGGKLKPQNEEWEWRGFRACDAIDPDGNVVQFRETAS
jgi:hypothetical protein